MKSNNKYPKNCKECYLFGSRCNHPNGDKVEIIDPLSKVKRCPIDEDELDAKWYRVNYRDEEIYLVIALKDGKPWEVFMEINTNKIDHLDFMISGWNTCTRFISMALKTRELKDVLCQLRRASLRKTDLPGILASKLEEWE